MERLCWVKKIMLVALVLVGCTNDEVTPVREPAKSVNNPLIGTWQVYNDPATDAHWIFGPTFLLYQELENGQYAEHSYTLTGDQLVIRSGPNQGSYGFTRDANQLTLVQVDTNQTTFFRWVSTSITPPSSTP